jgi:hypothetical protein
MKKLVVLLAAMWVFGAWASVSEIREFVAEPGQAGALYKSAAEARAIHQQLGATVYIGTDLITEHMLYVLTFPDWGAWAAFGTKLAASKEWDAFIAKVDVAKPSSRQLPVTYVDSPVAAKALPISVVYIWKTAPGKFDAFMKLAEEAVAIHTKLGASPGIGIDDMNNVGYELTFDSWAAWAKFDAASQKSPEWTAFLKKANVEADGDIARVLRLEEFKGP